MIGASSPSTASRHAALTLMVLLSGCASWAGIARVDPDVAGNVRPLRGPTPFHNDTPASVSLKCMRRFTEGSDIRVGVADLTDGTGAGVGDSDVNSKALSQRPDLMLTVALSRAGVRLVNRTSTAVAEWEMRQAMAKQLGDGKPVRVDNQTFDFRPVKAGEMLGSSYYINGAVTEMNWGLYSDVDEYGVLGVTAGRRQYRVQIALDLAVTKSSTTELVLARSYAKQMVGRELNAGVFRFVTMGVGPTTNTELFEANVGQKMNEPLQVALRWTVEAAAYDIVSKLFGRHPECDGRLADFIEGDTGGFGDGTLPPPQTPPAVAAPPSPAGTAIRTQPIPPSAAAPATAAPGSAPSSAPTSDTPPPPGDRPQTDVTAASSAPINAPPPNAPADNAPPAGQAAAPSSPPTAVGAAENRAAEPSKTSVATAERPATAPARIAPAAPAAVAVERAPANRVAASQPAVARPTPASVALPVAPAPRTQVGQLAIPVRVDTVASVHAADVNAELRAARRPVVRSIYSGTVPLPADEEVSQPASDAPAEPRVSQVQPPPAGGQPATPTPAPTGAPNGLLSGAAAVGAATPPTPMLIVPPAIKPETPKEDQP